MFICFFFWAEENTMRLIFYWTIITRGKSPFNLNVFQLWRFEKKHDKICEIGIIYIIHQNKPSIKDKNTKHDKKI